MSRLDDNSRVLLEAYHKTVAAIEAGRTITPASEWLVDNYHLVERHIREIHADLPRATSAVTQTDGGPLWAIRGCSARLGLRCAYRQPF